MDKYTGVYGSRRSYYLWSPVISILGPDYNVFFLLSRFQYFFLGLVGPDYNVRFVSEDFFFRESYE